MTTTIFNAFLKLRNKLFPPRPRFCPSTICFMCGGREFQSEYVRTDKKSGDDHFLAKCADCGWDSEVICRVMQR